eukprot:356544-Chlamydomonas_euryale.AAC.2
MHAFDETLAHAWLLPCGGLLLLVLLLAAERQKAPLGYRARRTDAATPLCLGGGGGGGGSTGAQLRGRLRRCDACLFEHMAAVANVLQLANLCLLERLLNRLAAQAVECVREGGGVEGKGAWQQSPAGPPASKRVEGVRGREGAQASVVEDAEGKESWQPASTSQAAGQLVGKSGACTHV